MHYKTHIKYFLFYSSVILISIFVCLFWGSFKISFTETLEVLFSVFKKENGPFSIGKQIILNIRLPRVIFAGLAGAVLSVCGVCMQGITGNDLAEPYILGISSGASAGAVSAIILHFFSIFSPFNIYMGAFLGSIFAMGGVLILNGKSRDPVKLILMGVGVNAFFSALTTYMIYSSKNEAQVRSAMFWTTGSLSGIQYADLILPAFALLALVIIVLLLNKEFNLLLLGLESAVETGLNINRVRFAVVLVTSAAVSVLTAKAGVIGFIGLIVPHIGRKFIGVMHRPLILWSAVFGASGLMIADTFARTMFSPSELPISVVTGLAGAPLFIKISKKSF
ncbi:FecCD family ABC transporter permease [Treponema pedis]|uniref:Transporter permease n=1 Tax=Treponema pedis str. T A4 TaxID=1291379 RepID=S6A975_9SPIR|nr:iron ABC transporter permease [Treponema pedis]AGT45084.1 transporter permease [Treponema pedis str. T A4]